MKNRYKYGIPVAILLIIGIGVVAQLAINAYAPVFNQYGDQRESASNIREQVTDADNAIKQYEWYIRQREKIDAQRRQINNTRDSLQRFYDTYGRNGSEWSFTTRERESRLVDRLQGYRDMHDNLVSEYNAQMNMETRNLYNDSLPLEMEKKFWTGDLIP